MTAKALAMRRHILVLTPIPAMVESSSASISRCFTTTIAAVRARRIKGATIVASPSERA